MDDFLIDLAKHATWQRILPFPSKFRITTTVFEPHTEEEANRFKKAIDEKDPDAIKYITTIDRSIVEHNKKSIHPSITEYEFQYSFIDNYRKNLKYPNRWYLFHGSPIGNWHSILRNGIKNMSGSQFMSSGAVYGDGVYLSDSLQIAGGYGKAENTVCVAVVEILVDPAPFLKTANIYVIPDDTILFPRYLFKMSRALHIPGTEVLEYYKKLRDSLIKPNLKVKRLEKDIQLISNNVLTNITKYCSLIQINGHACRCYVYNYPMQPPVIQLIAKTKNKNFDEYGCVIYPYEEWLPTNTLLDAINQVTKHFDDLVIDTGDNAAFDIC